MVGTINQSFTEVYDIVNHLDTNLYDKIPNQFIEMLRQNMDTNYNVKIDYSKNINEQELLQDTRIVLALIYRDYICSKEKRQKLIKKDMLEINMREEELKEKYNPDDIFKNRHKETIEETKEQENVTTMVEYKESVFTKFINFIKRLFRQQ